jgi:hypothetical protein
MIKIFIMLFFFLITNCTKPKTVLICGDHVCVNKTEAEQYFEENLSIEVKILNKKKIKNIDLVELNLKNNEEKNRKISIVKKNQTTKKIKTLSNEEVKKIKIKLKNKKENQKKIAKKSVTLKKKADKIQSKEINKPSNKVVIFENIEKTEIDDICKIISKCNIDEISKFLIGKGKKKKFPDITVRE